MQILGIINLNIFLPPDPSRVMKLCITSLDYTSSKVYLKCVVCKKQTMFTAIKTAALLSHYFSTNFFKGLIVY